jgi:hypothetical protein
LLPHLTHKNYDALGKICEHYNTMKTLVFNLFLTLVAAAVAVDLDGVENEMTTTATTTTTAPHAHIRGASDGNIKEKGEEEVTASCAGSPSVYQINDPNIGKRCRDDSDCTPYYRCNGLLFCVKIRPHDLYGKCAREPICHEEGDYCEEDHECCGSYICEDSICSRETNKDYCRPRGSACSHDRQCYDYLACQRSRCFGQADCKKQGGYCDSDYYQCFDGLTCGERLQCSARRLL